MVERMNLLVTGAAGFLGRAIVDEALRRGHRVRAVSRRELPMWNTEEVEGIAADLAVAKIEPMFDGIDAVIHCASLITGTDHEHQVGTVRPTERLAEVAAARGIPMVLVSSISVYGYYDLKPGDLVSEDTPLETRSEERDAYARAKLAQETAAELAGCPLTILRPGAIYGPARLWNGHLGVAKGSALIRIGRDGQIPLVHVESCARAAIAAAELPIPARTPLNIIDDNLPQKTEYIRMLRKGGWPKWVIPMPWRFFDRVGRFLTGPGLFRPETVRARMMPLTYSNARAKAQLAWVPEAHHDARITEALRKERRL